MRSWLVNGWLTVRASYWFIPSLMAAAAMVLSVVMIYVDTTQSSQWMRDIGWLYPSRPAGARSLLSTVAGSMITVAGVTFSMTLLAVSHASAQIGPRLMTNYMEDRGNQVTLGTFIATFLYCLMILRSVNTAGEGPDASAFVPQLSVMFALVLAIVSVFVLIYFIHHVPLSISVPRVIANVGDELERDIRAQYIENTEATDAEVTLSSADKQVPRELASVVPLGTDTGYLRLINRACLLQIATEHDLVVEVLLKPGDYAVCGEPLMKLFSSAELDDGLVQALTAAFTWGSERTREQDLRFPIEQMQEIIAKAMSPGVNGQYTALLCLDQLGRAIVTASDRRPAPTWMTDEHGTNRVCLRPVSQNEFARAVFQPVRQFLGDDGVTCRHWVSILKRIELRGPVKAWQTILQDEVSFFESKIRS